MNLAFQLTLLVVLLPFAGSLAAAGTESNGMLPPRSQTPRASQYWQDGRLLYQQGALPSGKTISARVMGDIELTGEQVVCGSCHRRSGLGSSEGQQVVPPVTGDILYAPLRLPVSKPPLPPLLRPAYTDATLKRAIREGVNASGEVMSAFMPRYPLTDRQLDGLLVYLKSLNTDPAPGVSDKSIHFATVIADSVTADQRVALLDVLRTFIGQKNAETRYESKRSTQGPWHKDWLFKPYRKWILHVWELHGAASEWPGQMAEYYRRQPVFAMLSGIAPGPWQPVHDFCEHNRVPCLFPNTSLPALDQEGFYTVYLNRGMRLEGEAVVQHLYDDELLDAPVVQVYRPCDPRGLAAAAALRTALERRGGKVTDIALPDDSGELSSLLSGVDESAIVVLWLPKSSIDPWACTGGPPSAVSRSYVSATLYGKPETLPEALRDKVYFVLPSELPANLPRLLARSKGWLRIKRIVSSEQQEIQADAFLTLKIAAGALKGIGGYFNRDYFLERIEHMVDNATYTSIYPRLSLAPGQRFVSKGVYIVRWSGDAPGELIAVTTWLIPGAR